jgi:molybdopterin synthase catalytic subunit
MTTAPVTTWAAVQDQPLSLDAALDAVEHPRAGAVVAFVGTVRDHDGGRTGVVELDYTAHPEAAAVLGRVVDRVAARPGVCGAAAVHRTGHLAVGERAVVCVVSAEHRAEAFEAARALIEELKHEVPIWKHQRFTDGDQEWVGL